MCHVKYKKCSHCIDNLHLSFRVATTELHKAFDNLKVFVLGPLSFSKSEVKGLFTEPFRLLVNVTLSIY